MAVCRLPLSSEAYFMLKSRDYQPYQYFLELYISWNTIVISVHVKESKYCLIMAVYMLPLSNEAYKCLNNEVFFISLWFRIVYSLNHISLPLFMLRKVNIALLLPFLGFHCLTKRTIFLNHEVIFISLFFRIFYSLNHILLLLFMLSKLSIALLYRFYVSIS